MERDKSQIVALEVTINFNSHAHVERDYAFCEKRSGVTISTHTLTWSVTGGNIYDNPELLNFNSHAHVERDHNVSYGSLELFISTHTLTWSVMFGHMLF